MKLFTKKSAKTANILKLVSLGMTLIILAPIIYVIDPVAKIVDSQMTLKTGSLFHYLWLKPPMDVYIKVFMFNVTNLDAFMRGFDAKLKVTEVGPYVYQEILENHNVTFNANNTVTYTPRRVVKFIREKSVGDPKVDKIIAPNIPYMGATSIASELSIFAALAFSSLTSRMKSKPMMEISVHEYLWGYDDNLVYLGSKILPSVINFQRFGLMERMFNEGDNVITIHLPTKDAKSSMGSMARDFSIDNWNGRQSIKYWTSSNKSNITNCNGIHGAYDGTLFPRDITKEETFRIYRKAFCRTVSIKYSHADMIEGIEAYHFKLYDNTFDSDIDDLDSSCFCTKKKCLRKGLGNITPCYYNMPLAISFPHFFKSDPSLLEDFEGLSPDEEKHGSKIALQPTLGIPMNVHSRFQINIFLDEIKYDRDMRKFSNMVLPIFWLEIAVDELKPCLKILLKLLFKICPLIQNGLITALIVAGLSLVGSAFFSCCWLPNSSSTFNKKKQTQKCNILLLESATNKTNVCIVPLLSPVLPKPATTMSLKTATTCSGEKIMMVLMPPRVEQQKSKSKLEHLKNKNYSSLPFLQNEISTS